jgi:hypothetical protein
MLVIKLLLDNSSDLSSFLSEPNYPKRLVV